MGGKPIQLMLWDLVRPLARGMADGLRLITQPPSRPPTQPSAPPSRPARRPSPPAPPTPRPSARRARAGAARAPGETGAAGSAPTMAERYEQVARAMLAKYNIRVRKWRSGTSGIAWYVEYRDGSIQRLIESPRPRGPMSMAVFLHEIGHHAIGFDVYKPRCLEEFHAWEFSLRTMRELNLNVTEPVLRRRRRSLEYAVGKACRRGIKSIPAELVEFIPARYRK